MRAESVATRQDVVERKNVKWCSSDVPIGNECQWVISSEVGQVCAQVWKIILFVEHEESFIFVAVSTICSFIHWECLHIDKSTGPKSWGRWLLLSRRRFEVSWLTNSWPSGDFPDDTWSERCPHFSLYIVKQQSLSWFLRHKGSRQKSPYYMDTLIVNCVSCFFG